MKAAVLNQFGAPLAIETLPDPVLGTGEVIVDVAAAALPAYTRDVLSGARNYMLELPVVPGPGGIGRIRATGPDATKLKAGDWVFCDSTVRARDDAMDPDMILQGWTARNEAGLALHRFYRHGSLAEQMRLPTECVTPIGKIDAADAGRWCALSALLVPYGGLLAIDLKPGETLALNGATGGFGGAGVAVALAMGAARVVATGRNGRALEALVKRFGERVKPAQMTGDEAADRARIMELAGGPIDAVLDLLPPEASAAQVRAGIMSVRPHGRVALMGGVGANGEELPLSYRWIMRNGVTLRGAWMYARDAVPRMVQMVRAGLIDLSGFRPTEFALDQVNEAVAYAAAPTGARLTVVRPDRMSA